MTSQEQFKKPKWAETLLFSRRPQVKIVDELDQGPMQIDNMASDQFYYRLEGNYWAHVDATSGAWMRKKAIETGGSADDIPSVIIHLRVMNDGNMSDEEIKWATGYGKTVTPYMHKEGMGPKYMDRGLYLTPGQFFNLADHKANHLDNEVDRFWRESEEQNNYNRMGLPLGVEQFDINNQGYGKYVAYEYDPTLDRVQYQIRTGRMDVDGELEMGWETDCCSLSTDGWAMLKKRMPVLRSELVQKMNRKPDWPPRNMPAQTVKAVEKKLVDILRPIALEAPIQYPVEPNADTTDWRKAMFDHILTKKEPQDLATQLTTTVKGVEGEVGAKAMHDLTLLFGLGHGTHLTERIMSEIEEQVQKKTIMLETRKLLEVRKKSTARRQQSDK